MNSPVLSAQRKAKGLCTDCGRSALDPKTGRILVRCTMCRARIAESRKRALAKGICTVCRTAKTRPHRTSCAPCGQKASEHHQKFMAKARKRIAMQEGSVIDSSSRAAVDCATEARGTLDI